MNKAGLTITLAFLTLALFSPLLTPYHPKEDLDVPLAAPSMSHLLGTDDVGRDILSQVMCGFRVSIFVGVTAGLAPRR